MAKGKLIMLNGGSSNGKSSTCEMMQNLLPDHFIHLGLDRFWSAMPPNKINLKTTTPDYMSYYSFEKDGKAYFQIVPGIELDKAMFASYRAIKAYLDYGVNVLSDQIFWKPEWFADCCQVLKDYTVFLVGMRVSDEEGTRREAQRRLENPSLMDLIGLWPDGWHRNTAAITHREMIYDFEIDNTLLDIQQTATKIIAAYNQCQQPTAMKKLYQNRFQK